MTIKEIRLLTGLSQREIAQRLDKKQSTISMWESGKSKPRMGDTVFKLAEILDTTPETIMRCFSDKA